MLDDDEISALVREALDGFEEAPLSASHRRALRIARRRGDLQAIWWLSLEHGSWDHRHEIRSELAPHFTAEEFQRLHEYFRERWIHERAINLVDLDGAEGEEKVESNPIPELEKRAAYFEELDRHERERDNVQLAVWASNMRGRMQTIIENLRARVFNYLSRTEVEVLAGRQPDVLVRARAFVIDRLAEVAPDASEQISEAEQALDDGTPERLSHAVLSCRRALKSLADAVYPPTDTPVVGRDGVERLLTDGRYVSRLWQFVYEQEGKHTRGEVLRANIEDLGHRIDALYDATSKGVHTDLSDREAAQFVTQTIMLCGDLLRVRDDTSAIAVDVDEPIPDTSVPDLPPGL